MYVELQIENHPDLKTINFWDDPFSHLSLCGICESDSHVDFDGLVETNDSWRLYFDGHYALEDAKFCQKILDQWFGNKSSKIQELENVDYNQSWKVHFKSIPISEDLIITPWFEDDVFPKLQESHCLYIYPGQGFGTGQHPTTHLCLRMVQKYKEDFLEGNILDFGSGSGILGLGVLLLTPQSTNFVDFVDIDPCANENCLLNVKINKNRIDSNRLAISEGLGEAENSRKYQAILSNILLAPNMEFEPFFQERLVSGGMIILSGVLDNQLPTLWEHYKAAGAWELVEMDILDQWGVLVLRKM